MTHPTPPSGKHRWLSDGGTLNPAPSPAQPVKETRDTAAGCRDRATADLLEALTMSTGNGRKILETSAASWTKRAELLQRIETGIEKRRDAPVLTEAEIAEDAAYLRS